MLGSGDPTPFDLPVTFMLAICDVTLLTGLLFGTAWPPAVSNAIRRGAFFVTLVLVAGIHLVTPTRDGIIGAGRLITIWPSAFLACLLFVAWTLRAGRL